VKLVEVAVISWNANDWVQTKEVHYTEEFILLKSGVTLCLVVIHELIDTPEQL
jgi:hypothetical protein